MADVDIDPFGEHDRTDDHTETCENIPFTPVGGGSQLGNQTEESKKLHLEENLKELNS